MARQFAIVLGLAGLLAAAGCQQETRTLVRGKATVDGKPLTSKAVTVLFAPDKDNPLKKIPWGLVDDDGNYQMSTGDREGVPLGSYKAYLAFNVRKSGGARLPCHPRYLDAAQSPLSIEVVADPQPGAYDLKFTEN